MSDIEKEYKKLKKRYRLPKLKELKKEFKVKLEDPDLILQDIIDRITEEISKNAKILESIIFVRITSEPSSLYETKMLKKKEAFELFKRFMSIYWKGKRIETAGKDSEMASFIRDTFDSWIKKLKGEFVEICESLERKWKDASLEEHSKRMMYHG